MDSGNNPNFFKRFINYLKFLWSIEDPGQFRVDGRKTYKIISVLIIMIGLMAALGGYGMYKAGNLTRDRYEQTSGRFIRRTSVIDKAYYDMAKKSLIAGFFLMPFGFIVLVCGLCTFIKPQSLHYLVDKYSSKS
jgi:hypothetical protein